MIQKLSHATFFVLDQEVAKDVYVNKLGFELRNDVDMGNGFKWLTVSPPGQPDVEIVLMGTTPSPALDKEASEKVRWLLEHGKMGAGVFEVADCRKTYEELKEKGIEFANEPTEQFYGIEAIMKDGCGNWFSMTQRK